MHVHWGFYKYILTKERKSCLLLTNFLLHLNSTHLLIPLSFRCFLLVLACSLEHTTHVDSEEPRGVMDIPASQSCGHVSPFTVMAPSSRYSLSSTYIFKTRFKWYFPQSLPQPLQPETDCFFLEICSPIFSALLTVLTTCCIVWFSPADASCHQEQNTQLLHFHN